MNAQVNALERLQIVRGRNSLYFGIRDGTPEPMKPARYLIRIGLQITEEEIVDVEFSMNVYATLREGRERVQRSDCRIGVNPWFELDWCNPESLSGQWEKGGVFVGKTSGVD